MTNLGYEAVYENETDDEAKLSKCSNDVFDESALDTRVPGTSSILMF